jgi:signal transduction histidine kinase
MSGLPCPTFVHDNISLEKRRENRDYSIVQCSGLRRQEETIPGGRHPLQRSPVIMPDTAEEQDRLAEPQDPGRPAAALEIPPDMIAFHAARTGRLRAGAFAGMLRRVGNLLGRRRTPSVDPAASAGARRLADIDRLGESLRQPLTSIRSLSEILRENLGLPADEHAHILGLIVEETKRLNRLIGQCLDLGAEAGIANDRYSERDRRGAA